MEPIAVGRVDLTQYHDCSVSDSGYYSFEETQLGDNSYTGCGIEGLGRNCGPSPILAGTLTGILSMKPCISEKVLSNWSSKLIYA